MYESTGQDDSKYVNAIVRPIIKKTVPKLYISMDQTIQN